jgi:hypothetical protein
LAVHSENLKIFRVHAPRSFMHLFYIKIEAQMGFYFYIWPGQAATTAAKPQVVRRVSEVCCGASDLREKVTKRTFMVREELLERKDDVPQCTAASTSPAFR